MSDSRDIGYAIFGLGFGVWYFFHGLGVLRKKRLIESIPTSTVRGLAIGLVELNGKAKKVKTLQAPLTGVECTFYRYTVERLESSGRSSRWVLIAQGDSVVSPFCLDDSTGQILVLPKGAEFLMPPDFSYTTSFGSGLPDNLVSFMERSGIQYKGLFGNYTLRFHEWHIVPDEPVFVVGTAQKNNTLLDDHREELNKRLQDVKQFVQQPADANLLDAGGFGIEGWKKAEANAEHDLLQQEVQSGPEQGVEIDVIIAKGEGDIFIVSDESQTQVFKSFSWQAVCGIWGGSALSLALLAYLLFRLGMWAKF